MDAEFKKRFLTNTDDSGRFIVKSRITGKTYYVEPIDNYPEKNPIWGDWTPSLKSYTGKYGKKHIGSVAEDDSMITKKNGFEKIYDLPAGVSPSDYINQLDKELEEKLKNNGKK